MLPNEANPLLIFLGVGKNGGNAVFLVDSTLTGRGRGQVQAEQGRLRVPLPGARLASRSSPTTTATPTRCASTQIRKVKVDADERLRRRPRTADDANDGERRSGDRAGRAGSARRCSPTW